MSRKDLVKKLHLVCIYNVLRVMRLCQGRVYFISLMYIPYEVLYKILPLSISTLTIRSISAISSAVFSPTSGSELYGIPEFSVDGRIQCFHSTTPDDNR